MWTLSAATKALEHTRGKSSWFHVFRFWPKGKSSMARSDLKRWQDPHDRFYIDKYTNKCSNSICHEWNQKHRWKPKILCSDTNHKWQISSHHDDMKIDSKNDSQQRAPINFVAMDNHQKDVSYMKDKDPTTILVKAALWLFRTEQPADSTIVEQTPLKFSQFFGPGKVVSFSAHLLNKHGYGKSPCSMGQLSKDG